jgi:hypothetical protein
MAHRGRKNADEALLLSLACGSSTEKAAADAGVSPRTVHRRMADAAFRARLHEMRGEMLKRAGGALSAAALRAVQTLLSLQDRDQPAGVRLGAARAILELGLRIREAGELEDRLVALEQQVGAEQSQPLA